VWDVARAHVAQEVHERCADRCGSFLAALELRWWLRAARVVSCKMVQRCKMQNNDYDERVRVRTPWTLSPAHPRRRHSLHPPETQSTPAGDTVYIRRRHSLHPSETQRAREIQSALLQACSMLNINSSPQVLSRTCASQRPVQIPAPGTLRHLLMTPARNQHRQPTWASAAPGHRLLHPV